MTNWPFTHMFKRLSIVLVLLSVLIASTPSCRTIDATFAPAEVVATVNTESAALAKAETSLAAGTLDDPALIKVLTTDADAWKYLRDNSHSLTMSADMKAVLQTQEIGVRSAIKKIAASEYTPAEKTELLQTLHKAWQSLETYYHPKTS